MTTSIKVDNISWHSPDFNIVPVKGISNPLAPIEDLVEELSKVFRCDWMIAGGYCRDLVDNKPFNDIDIYIYEDQLTFNGLLPQIKSELASSRHFIFLESSSDSFLDGMFVSRPSQFSSQIKYRIQIIGNTWNPWQALNRFDFESNRFFIPLKGLKTKSGWF